MGWFDDQQISGSGGWGNYNPYYQGGGGQDPGGGGGGDINPQGAADDPFAYTKGSLLTPWEGHFSSGGFGGGNAVPAFNPFQFDKFNYKAPDVGSFAENYADPAAFRFADFGGPSQFKAPTEEEMMADPGYQARLNAGMQAQKAAGAHSGALRTGGFAKGMSDYAQNAASQEYDKVYGRRQGEWGQEWNRAKDIYGINQGNTKSAFDTNVANRLAAYKTRQGTWQANADIGLRQGELGYNVATGTYDRNLQLARQQYEDQASHDAAVAAAANAGAGQNYQRSLDDYLRSRDEFWTNQDRQYALLDREANRGLGAVSDYGNQMMGAYGGLGNLAIGGADARASGQMGSANAWGNAVGGIGGTLGGLALYGSQSRSAPTGGGGAAPLSRIQPNYTAGLPSSIGYQPSVGVSASRGWSSPFGVGSSSPYSGIRL